VIGLQVALDQGGEAIRTARSYVTESATRVTAQQS
jgi:hypothetical protein